jgi:drug/metabolite transporter (DMT)-like permease
MNLSVAILAALGCSICNGISTVQQKVGADREHNIRKLDFTLLLRLLKDAPYVFGLLLAIFGYALSFVALRVLPLFLVQSVIAASVVVTAFGEQLILHKRLNKQTYIALGAIIVGLVFLSISAVSGRAKVSHQSISDLVAILPLPLAFIGVLFIYLRSKISALILAAIGGLLYGNTSTIARIFSYPHPLWKLIENPLLYGLIASAILGQYFFTIALQRTTATKSNAIMITLQTFGPAIFGLLFFDDKIRSGFAGLVLFGSLLVIIGSAATAVDESPIATI